VALVVVDAGVVIAHLDPADAHHRRAVAALQGHADHDLRLPASAYAEALVKPALTGQIEGARRRVEALSLAVEPIGEAVAERAAALRAAEPSLRLPDALTLACGDVLDAAAVLTTDHRWARFPRVHLVG
jgi:predicted nucleic acid-binding protein